MKDMHDGRRYEEGCFSAHALDIVGDRWTLLIVRELLLGPLRFGEIKAGISGISANILSRRLDDLQHTGILRHTTLAPPTEAPAYQLTASGQGLWPVIRSLCRWGATQQGHDPTLFVSPASVMLSMAAVYQGKRLSLDAGFSLGSALFTLRLQAGVPKVARATRLAGDLTFSGTPNAVGLAMYGPLPLAASVAEGRVGFTGDPVLAQAFVDGFDLFRSETEPAPFALVPT
jgi:DNA-binding HxlR family transcriptional regulator